MREPIEEFGLHGGVQKIFRFANGYGASVVRHRYSHGHERGYWELAVIKFYGEESDDWEITYSAPITSDVVMGNLKESEVDELLAQIEALPAIGDAD